jgi:tRNA threonylcarbamoyladenosine biosynthesis protein TsaB
VKVLVLKTDGPKAYIALYENRSVIGDLHWESGKELARDLLAQISLLLRTHGCSLNDIEGLACFAGPGSFTSLRIGIATMNALAYAKELPIVSGRGEEWLEESLSKLHEGASDRIVTPEYGSEPHITVQKK